MFNIGVIIKGDDAEKTKVVPSEHADDSFEDADDCTQLDEIYGKDLPLEKNNPVKVITAADISAGNYTTEDIILPMPGSRIIYPTNEDVDVYHDMVKKVCYLYIKYIQGWHQLDRESIISRNGTYRRVVQKPIDFHWELLPYTDGNIASSETHLDKIAKTKPVNLTNGPKAKSHSIIRNNERASMRLRLLLTPSFCKFILHLDRILRNHRKLSNRPSHFLLLAMPQWPYESFSRH
ncbi:hypothetical protein F3Y22_tig00003435pilonHSYRG00137 [Hibiscus syriacus]|uniref:Uncharacterized protein n=1 Tax=Hibiscus syriacus TaxID=106335 RepID=A0A6A3CK01_HIBSY|nr:hypothetical protein F3Y22_tig00003435pilonHSYRG00137 [Hibiscus syriacus]